MNGVNVQYLCFTTKLQTEMLLLPSQPVTRPSWVFSYFMRHSFFVRYIKCSFKKLDWVFMWLLSIRKVINFFALMNEYTALDEWPVYVSAMSFRRCAEIKDSVALWPDNVS